MYNPRNHHALYSAINASGVNSRTNSVSVSELFKKFPTGDETEWRKTFDKHSKMTLDQCKEFAYNFTQSKDHWKHLPEKDVHGFVDALFVEWTLRGFRVEKAIMKHIKDLTQMEVRQATPEEDMDFGIDLILSMNGEDIAAMQVKPISYLNNIMQGKHQWQHKSDTDKNTKYGKPVFWVYYSMNSDKKTFKMSNRDAFYKFLNIKQS